MVEVLKEIPSKIAGFRVTGTVTRQDYEKIILPATEEKLRETGEINFLLLVDTDISKFTFGAWMQDAFLGLKHFSKWRKAAIITDSEPAIKFTDGFSAVAPGEFKGFKKEDYEAALLWVAS